MFDEGPKANPPADETPVTLLARSEGWRGFGLAELWHDRELLFFLAQRDIKVRYKQTFFGAAWAIGQPFITMVVFTLIFGQLAGLSSEGFPYPVFVLCGLVPWGLASASVPAMSTSLVNNEELITKVRIHSMLVPASVVLAGLVDLAVATAFLLVIAARYGVYPSPELLLLPAFVVLAVVIVLGLGLLFSAVSVIYRDIRYVVPFGVQLWLFLTPVVYPASEVSADLRWIYSLNPMVGVVEGFRWSVLGGGDQLATALPFSIVGAGAVLLLGCFVFRKLEPLFADAV